MNEKCEVLWTAKCKVVTPAPPPHPRYRSGEYTVHHRFGLMYYPNHKTHIKVGDYEFDGPDGSYICIPPDTKFRITHSDGCPNNPKVYFDITFLVHDPVLEKRLRQLCPPRLAGAAEKTMLNYIVENWHRQNDEIRSNCNSFLTTLLLLLFAEQTKPEASGSQFILTDGFSRATLVVLDYIERSYLSRFTLEEVANATGYNKNYLCMSFTKNTGIPIVAYTNFLRIRKAIGTILYFPKPISLISESLAFDNPNYFGRTFKAFTGISPREFNKAAQKMTPEEKADLYATEPLLKYRRCPLEDALASMRHIGERVKVAERNL